MRLSQSVGYGDLNIKSGYSHVFIFLYIVFSITLFAFVARNIAILKVQQSQLELRKNMTRKRQQMGFLLELDKGQGVSEEQFILAVLLQLDGLKMDKDIQPWKKVGDCTSSL